MPVVDESPPRAVCATHIERVVVHRNGALVTRRGNLTNRGRVDVELLGLPLTFSAETLRVRGVGCRVGLVDEIARAELVRAPAVVDEAALVEHRLRIAAVDARRALVQRLLQCVGDLRVALPPADVDGLPALDVIAGLGRVRDAQRRALTAELRALDDERTALARETERLERTTTQQPAQPRLVRGVRAQIDDAVDDAALEVEYFVPAARWVPSYTLHLDSAANGRHAARLVLGALVAQATGEDWNDVELAVSTADLRRDTTLPPLHSWRLGRAQPSTMKGFRPLPSDLSTLFSGWDRFPRVTPPVPPASPSPAPPVRTAPDDLRTRSFGRAAPTTDAEEVVLAFDGGFDDAVTPTSSASVVHARSAAPPPMAAAAPSVPPPSMPRPGAPTPRRTEVARANETAGGGGVLGRVPEAMAAAPVTIADELPPRLRTAALRMAGAEETDRGLLLAMTGREHLAWLLDPVDLHDGAGADHDDLVVQVNRALDVLERAGRRMLERGPPAGTRSPAGATRVFVAAGRASVPGDGDEHRVEVHHETSTAATLHVAIPRASLDVHRACRFVVAGPLPAGPVQVYEDGVFVVASELPVTGGGTPVRLQLGVDPDVRVQARTPHVHQSEKGLVGGTSVVEHRVVVEARSSRPASVTLSLFDRVPVADEGQRDLVVGAPWLKINGASSTFAGTGRGPHDESLAGGVRIDVLLQPGIPAVVEHGYALTLPAKLEVIGGNRRE